MAFWPNQSQLTRGKPLVSPPLKNSRSSTHKELEEQSVIFVLLRTNLRYHITDLWLPSHNTIQDLGGKLLLPLPEKQSVLFVLLRTNLRYHITGLWLPSHNTRQYFGGKLLLPPLSRTLSELCSPRVLQMFFNVLERLKTVLNQPD